MKPIKPLLLSLVGIGVIGWVGYSFYQAYQPQPVKLQGQIDAQQYSISSKVPGRIDEIFVRKGDSVEKGWSDKRSLNEAFGWHHPALDRTELAYLPRSISDKIRKVSLHLIKRSYRRYHFTWPLFWYGLKISFTANSFSDNC